MSKSNPEAVAAIEQRAATAAVEADRQRRTALDAAFPDDLKFAADSYAANLSVDAAKAQRHDALAAELKALKTENADLKSRVEAGKPGFVATDGEGQTSGTSGADGGDTLAEFESIWSKHPEVVDAFDNNKKRFLAVAKHNPQRVRNLIGS